MLNCVLYLYLYYMQQKKKTITTPEDEEDDDYYDEEEDTSEEERREEEEELFSEIEVTVILWRGQRTASCFLSMRHNGLER